MGVWFKQNKKFLPKRMYNVFFNLVSNPGGSAVKNPPAMRETWVQSLDWEDPLEKG